jgi:hypothetical protein
MTIVLCIATLSSLLNNFKYHTVPFTSATAAVAYPPDADLAIANNRGLCFLIHFIYSQTYHVRGMQIPQSLASHLAMQELPHLLSVDHGTFFLQFLSLHCRRVTFPFSTWSSNSVYFYTS